MSRQIKLLLFIGLILAGSLYFSYWWYPHQEIVSEETGLLQFQPRVGMSAQPQAELVGLSLDFGKQNIGPFKSPQKDIFGPLYVEKKIKKARKPKPKPVVKQKPKPVVKPIIVIAPTVQKPAAIFNLLGYLDKSGVRTVFLSQKDQVYLVKEGDVFAQEYRVVELTSDLLLIKSETDQRETRIEFKKPQYN